MLRSLIASAFVLAALPARAEPTTIVVHPPWEQRARSALVHVETAWTSAVGVLVGPQRVYATFGFLDTGRGIEVRAAAGGPVIEVRARVYERDHARAWVLELEAPIAGTPLELSQVPEVTPGMHVYGFESRGGGLDQAQLVEALVGTVGNGHFTIASHAWTFVPGTPVLDGEGRLLGLLGPNLEVLPAQALTDETALEERGLSVLPLIGYRFGYEHGGLLGDGGTFDIELGVTLADRVSLVGRFGIGFGARTSDTLLLPEVDGLGPGRVPLGDNLALRLGLEGRYRFYLGGGELPFYLDLAAGVVWTSLYRTPTGPTLRSTEPGCDPVSDACPIRIDPTPTTDPLSALDASVGIDVRWGPMSLGYRFMPGLGDAPAAHQLLFGASFF